MNNIKIISSGKYIPKIQITNKELEEKYNVEENYIFKAKILCRRTNRRACN